MKAFEKYVPDGTPWIDYKEADKSTYNLVFAFRIENFLQFVLREICITFPCAALGVPQLPLNVTVQATSTQNQFTPKLLPPRLFSSPSENYRLGVLGEGEQGGRLQPIVYNYPCEKGENLIVTISGDPVGIEVGCMLHGRKYGGEQWL